MAWEMRGGCGPYYTRSRRVNARVVREYIGGGQIGHIAAEFDAIRRAERIAEADARRQEITEIEELDRIADDLGRATDEAMRTVLEAAGFHQHRGEWRRKRGRIHSWGNATK